jgi:hypothetical protein
MLRNKLKNDTEEEEEDSYDDEETTSTEESMTFFDSNVSDSSDTKAFTPIFYTNEEYNRLKTISWEKKCSDLESHHSNLEQIEKRIKKNPDANKHDVNLVVELSLTTYHNIVFLGRRKRQKSFQNIKELNIKPEFWPPRCYDENMKELNKKETDFLKSKINKLIEQVPMTDFEEPRINKIKNRRFNSQHSIVFPIFNYETESDDDHTEWSDDVL